MKSASPTDAVIKKLFALSRNRCAFPDCGVPIVQPSGTITGKVCHIKAKSPGGARYDSGQTEAERHAFDNLILLCGVHHDIVDAEPERYTVKHLQAMKQQHERNGDIELSQEAGRLARLLIDQHKRIEASGQAQVMVDSPGGIQARTITIKTNRKNPPIPLPGNVIGANAEMRSYAEYLVKRYIDWRLKGVQSGKDRRRFHPSMTHQLIERHFGARYNLVPQTEFDRLVSFLHNAIDDTIIGRIQLSDGSRNYHSFEEHLQKLRPRGRK